MREDVVDNGNNNNENDNANIEIEQGDVADVGEANCSLESYDSNDVRDDIAKVLSVVDLLVTDVTNIDEDLESMIEEYSSTEFLNSFNISTDERKEAATYVELLETYNKLFERKKQLEDGAKEKDGELTRLRNSLAQASIENNSLKSDHGKAVETSKATENYFKKSSKIKKKKIKNIKIWKRCSR